MYFSNNQGEKWIKFSSGLPTISIRDLAIQKRENDLVLATFGRGFYVLDDYNIIKNSIKSIVRRLYFLMLKMQFNIIQFEPEPQVRVVRIIQLKIHHMGLLFRTIFQNQSKL